MAGSALGLQVDAARCLFGSLDLETDVLEPAIEDACSAFVDRKLGVNGFTMIIEKVGDPGEPAGFFVGDAEEDDVAVEGDLHPMQQEQHL